MALVLLLLNISSCSDEADIETHVATDETPCGCFGEAPLAGVEPITATITLRGFPEDDLLDAAGHVVVTGALENVEVGTYVLLEGNGSAARQEAIAGYAWTLDAPDDSSSALDNWTSRTPVFVPDTTGPYTVTLRIANHDGFWGPAASLTVHAGTWVGSGLNDKNLANPPHCIACHANRMEAWADTRHATGFDGAVAENAGFDDVVAAVGWTFPKSLIEGIWERLATNNPPLAGPANVQCENCHGPGSEHSGRREGIAISLKADVCDICHDPLHQFRAAQWYRSGHNDVGFVIPSLSAFGNERCGRCHSGQGFIDDLDGKAVVGGGLPQVTCAVCHDPHNATHQHQLRIFDTVTLPGGIQVTDAGPSALCMTCHNGGVSSEEVFRDEPTLPHGSTASEMAIGTGGYDYGQTIEDSAHSAVVRDCLECHMAPTPGVDDGGTPDDTGDDIPLPGHNRLGEHTFKMAWNGGTPVKLTDDVENVAACTDCHEGLSTFNRKAKRDYDGDGATEGIQDEVWGLLNLVYAELQMQGVQWQGEHPNWGTVTTEAQKGALYNLSFVLCDGSLGIHNTGRAVGLLQLAYRYLTERGMPDTALP